MLKMAYEVLNSAVTFPHVIIFDNIQHNLQANRTNRFLLEKTSALPTCYFDIVFRFTMIQFFSQ
jgi:hypothetical protein